MPGLVRESVEDIALAAYHKISGNRVATTTGLLNSKILPILETMHVALNTQTIAGQKSGFGWYVSNLLDWVPKTDPSVRYEAITPTETSNHLSTPQRFWWDQVGFARACHASTIDLVHQPCFSAPFFTGKPLVVTCCDIIPTLFPENFSLPSRIFFGSFMPFSYRAADHIIAISEHTKRDLVEVVKVKPERITVIPLAAGPTYHPLRKDEEAKLLDLKRELGIGERYFLHVGTIEPRKNLDFLVEAFSEAKRAGKLAEQLVITGKKGWRTEALLAKVSSLGISDAVVFTGYVSDESIPLLMAGATAFLFPSLYEGFGLPPLEAMACGTLTIAARTSSVPEVVGDTGILLAPTDTAGWVRAMSDVSSSPKQRDVMGKKALERASTFSWERCAKQTVEVYENVLRKYKK